MISDLSPGDKLSLKGQLFELQKKLSLIELHKSALVDCSFTPNMIAKYDVANREENFYDNVSKAEMIKKQKLAMLKASLEKEETCTFAPQMFSRPKSMQLINNDNKRVPGRNPDASGSGGGAAMPAATASTASVENRSSNDSKPVYNRLYDKANEYRQKQKARTDHFKTHDSENQKLFHPKVNTRSTEILSVRASKNVDGAPGVEETNKKPKGAGLYNVAIELKEKRKKAEDDAVKKVHDDANKPKINSQSEKWLKIKIHKEGRYVYNWILSGGTNNMLQHVGLADPEKIAEATEDESLHKIESSLLSLNHIRAIIAIHSQHGYLKSHIIDRASMDIWGEITENDGLIEVVDFQHMVGLFEACLGYNPTSSKLKSASSRPTSASASTSSTFSNANLNVNAKNSSKPTGKGNAPIDAAGSSSIFKYPMQVFYANCLLIMNATITIKENDFTPKINDRSRALAKVKDEKDKAKLNVLLQSDNHLKSSVASLSQPSKFNKDSSFSIHDISTSEKDADSKDKNDDSNNNSNTNSNNDYTDRSNNEGVLNASEVLQDGSAIGENIHFASPAVRVEVRGDVGGEQQPSNQTISFTKSQLLHARQVLKEKRLADKRKEIYDKQMLECSFRPKVNAYVQASVGSSSNSISKDVADGNLPKSGIYDSPGSLAPSERDIDDEYDEEEERVDDSSETSETRKKSVFSRLYSLSRFSNSGSNVFSYTSEMKEYKENCTFSPSVKKLVPFSQRHNNNSNSNNNSDDVYNDDVYNDDGDIVHSNEGNNNEIGHDSNESKSDIGNSRDPKAKDVLTSGISSGNSPGGGGLTQADVAHRKHILKLKNDSIKKNFERIKNARAAQEKNKEDYANFGKLNEEKYMKGRNALIEKGAVSFNSKVEERIQMRKESNSRDKGVEKKTPKMLVDIKITPTRTIHIPIYHYDDPYQLAYSLTKIYALDSRVEGVLAEAIRQSMIKMHIPINPDSDSQNDGGADSGQKLGRGIGDARGREIVDMNDNYTGDNIDSLFDRDDDGVLSRQNGNPEKQIVSASAFKKGNIFSSLLSKIGGNNRISDGESSDDGGSESSSSSSESSVNNKSMSSSNTAINSKKDSNKASTFNTLELLGKTQNKDFNIDDDFEDFFVDNIERQANAQRDKPVHSTVIPPSKESEGKRKMSITDIFGLGGAAVPQINEDG